MEAEKVDPPELAGSFGIETRAWWAAWLASPQVEFFAATDWQTLLRLAPLVDSYYQHPTPQLAGEIRQTEAKLGATIGDRERLGWTIDAPVDEGGDAPPDEARPKSSRDRPDPRLNPH